MDLPANRTDHIRLKHFSYRAEVTHHTLELKGLPAELEGATIVQLTDLHCGYGGTDPVLHWAVEQTRALNPDFILITGDFIDDHCKVKDYPLAKLLRPLCAKRAIYACYGNHDHRHGLAEVSEKLSDAGIPLLINQAVEAAPGFWIAGIDDLHEGSPNLEKTLREVPQERTALVLSHNPSLIDSASDHNIMIFSGHTHAAQMHIPFPSPKLVCKIHLHCNQVEGWYHNGKASLYVCRGIGVTGFPMRINCPAELPVFHMHNAGS